MPAISDIPVHLSVEVITRAWDPRRVRSLTPALRDNINKLLARIETDGWLQSAIHYRIVEVTDRGPHWLAMGSVKLDSGMVAGYLHQAQYLVFGVCTLGQRLVQQISDWFAEKKHLQAVLLDEIGTLLLYQISEYFELQICERARWMGLEASGALNPGDEDFNLSLQGTVLALAGGGDIGVTLKGSGTLSPLKSMTAVIGLGRDMPARSRADRCENCCSRRRCPHNQAFLTGVPA